MLDSQLFKVYSNDFVDRQQTMESIGKDYQGTAFSMEYNLSDIFLTYITGNANRLGLLFI